MDNPQHTYTYKNKKQLLYIKKLMKTKAKFWCNRYKYYRDKPNALISKSKKTHLHKYFQENYLHSKRLWQKINEHLYTSQKYAKRKHLSEWRRIILIKGEGVRPSKN